MATASHPLLPLIGGVPRSVIVLIPVAEFAQAKTDATRDHYQSFTLCFDGLSRSKIASADLGRVCQYKCPEPASPKTPVFVPYEERFWYVLSPCFFYLNPTAQTIIFTPLTHLERHRRTAETDLNGYDE